MRCVGQKHKSGAVGHHQWGKYGVINESECVLRLSHCGLVLTSVCACVWCSLYNKEQEFRAWLVEERKINPETITKDQTKKEFARFAEDYNTGESRGCFSPKPWYPPQLLSNRCPERCPGKYMRRRRFS